MLEVIEREIDPRAALRGVRIITPPLAAGQRYWRVVKVRWYDEQESEGRHHIYVEGEDINGASLAGLGFIVSWPRDSAYSETNGRSGFDAGNFPMSPSRNEFSVAIDSSAPSEVVRGIGMGADTPSGFNPGLHTSTLVVFRLSTAQDGSVESPGKLANTIHLPYVGNAPTLAPQAEPDRARLLFERLRDHPDQKRKGIRWSEKLAIIAFAHIVDQAHNGYTGHVDLNGNGANERIRKAGYRLPTFYSHDKRANNCESLLHGGDGDLDGAWDAWLSSPGHKAHLLAEYSFYAEQVEVATAFYELSTSTYRCYWAIIAAHAERAT